MRLYEALGIAPDASGTVALVGGGGKTSALFCLAQELKALKKKILITTTTHIGVPKQGECDSAMLEGADSGKLAAVRPGTIVCLGGGVLQGKICKVKGVDPAFIDRLHCSGWFDWILVEADGAKRKSVKAPAGYEPVIPASATMTIGVIGLDCLGKPIDEQVVHRCTVFCRLTGKKLGEPIDPDCIMRLIMSRAGLFKGAPAAGRKIVLLNKADTASLMLQGGQIARELARVHAPVHGCVIASLQQQEFCVISQGQGAGLLHKNNPL